jgi:drug/metabolite transporter (DMT)-like permease
LNTTSVEGTALNTSGPIWAALLALFLLGERLNAQRWLAIGLGFVGSYILTMGFGLPEFKESSTAGNMIYLVGVVLEMLGMVLAKKVILRSSGMGTIAWQMVGMAIWSSLIPLAFPATFPAVCHHVSWSSLAALAYLVLIAGVVCFTAWYKIAEKTPVSFMALLVSVEPLVAALLGSLFLKEPLTVELIFGMVLVLAAVGVAGIEKPLRRVTVRKVPKYQTEQHEHRNNYDQEPGIGLGSVFQVGREETAD